MHIRSRAVLLLALMTNALITPAYAVDSKPPATRPPGIGEPGDTPFKPKPRPNPAPVTPAPTSPITYLVRPNGSVYMKFTNADVLAEQTPPQARESINKYVAELEENARAEQAVYDLWQDRPPGVDKEVALDVVDEERMLADLKSESRLMDELIWFGNVVGVGAFGAMATHLAGILSQNQSIPASRIAFVLTAIAGATAQGGIKSLENRKTAIGREISSLEAHVEAREKYLFWASDYGGDITRRPPTCIYKTTCVETEWCTGGFMTGRPEICRKSEDCSSELLTCRSEE